MNKQKVVFIFIMAELSGLSTADHYRLNA